MLTMNRTALDVVLDAVNELREHYDLGPAIDAMPCGTPKDPTECPVALALGDTALVTNHHAFLYGLCDEDEDGIDLPFAVKVFIDEFDDGLYPELVAFGHGCLANLYPELVA